MPMLLHSPIRSTASKMRDKYMPGAQIWVTESGDAGGGGNTWASTFVDVFRTLNELGTFATLTDGVIFHNTLASSDYGFLKHGTFDPRPNYFAVLLWNRIMGTTVYDTKEEIREGAHVFAHSRRDGKDGVAYCIINNSETEATTVELTKAAGGTFIISPNTNKKVIAKTCELGMVSIPGALTPTECVDAHEAGADFVKLFPITNLGSGYVKAMKAPLSHIRFLGVGGIDENNMA